MSVAKLGQETGQAPGHEQGLSWAELIDALVRERGSLALVAQHLAERRSFAEDVTSVERGLRRLRERGSKDGGVWGERVLRCFGLPAEVDDRVRWMGQYHTRFTDLPASLCDELLRPWDRPPVSESPARIWVLLGRVNLALRRRQRDDVEALLDQARLLAHQAEVAAQIELLLLTAFLRSRPDHRVAKPLLGEAETLLETRGDALRPDDAACLFARWIDQLAYPLNKPRSDRSDHAGAVALYERIPADGPLFARSRRENGLGWSWLQLGERARAQAHARASVEAAGDSGSLRMRAMALNLLAATLEGGDEAERARARARAIAHRLEDEALVVRFGGPK
jgi:hypothetical protein